MVISGRNSQLQNHQRPETASESRPRPKYERRIRISQYVHSGDADGFYKEFTEKSRNYTYEAMLSYNKTWKDFNISASVGANSQDFLFRNKTRKSAHWLLPTLSLSLTTVLPSNPGRSITRRKSRLSTEPPA